MANTKPPCKDCSDRHYGCHSECRLYIDYDKERKAELERRKTAWKIERGIVEHFVRLGTKRKKGGAKCKTIHTHKK